MRNGKKKTRGRGGELHVGLLRGINVGGKNRLPMRDLVGIFEEAGCREVRTYIQSGNVLFRASTALARRVPHIVTGAIERDFGFHSPVVTRTRTELEAVARENPFLKEGAESSALHVAFLVDRPGKSRLGSLDPDRSAGDRFAVRGREIYLHCPKGIGRSKLTTSYFDSKLETVSTLRNWKTVLELLERAEGENR